MSYDLSVKECFFKVQEERGDRRIVLTHYFRLPTSEDWTEYHKGTAQMGLSKGKDTIELSGVRQERDSWLWEQLIQRVEGYKYSGTDLMEREDWKALIPLPHKLESVSGFLLGGREGVPSDADMIEDDTLDLAEGAIEVQYKFLQNSVSKLLTFFFNTPDAKDYLRFSKLSTKMQLQRTKQRGVSAIRVPTDITPYVDLFDKLINKVEGYVYQGKDLMKAEKWKEKVDAYHKRMVVQEVFSSSLQEDEGKESGA